MYLPEAFLVRIVRTVIPVMALPHCGCWGPSQAYCESPVLLKPDMWSCPEAVPVASHSPPVKGLDCLDCGNLLIHQLQH